MTRNDEGETSKGLSPDLIQVCHFLIYAIWVCLQGVNTFLCWHVMITILQITRIILMKSISKIMLVCLLLTVSDGWSKLLGLRGVVAVTLISVCELCIDASTKITGKDGFVLFCEITMIMGNAVYLMGILLIKHKMKANLWVIVGTITLSVFILGFILRCEDITLLGIIILLNRLDKMQSKLNQYMRCCERTVNLNSVDPLSV